MQETDFPFEIIIHDDASTDASATVIEKYVKLYPNLIKPMEQEQLQAHQIIATLDASRKLTFYVLLQPKIKNI